MISKLINDDNYLNIYRFGSHVYGTNNEQSDEDLICVVKNKIERPDINVHVYTEKEYQTFLDSHDIQILECQFLPHVMFDDIGYGCYSVIKNKHEVILKQNIKFNFTLDKNKLRQAISTVSNGAWIKGKKKLTVQADYNKLLGIKSIFHSIRILDFGTQIAEHGKIVCYSSCNLIWKDILFITESFEHQEAWAVLELRYKSQFNEMKNKFAKLCPLGYDKNDIKKNKIVELLKGHGVEDDGLVNQIFEVFIKNK